MGVCLHFVRAEIREKVSDSLEPVLQMIVSCLSGAEN